MSKIVCDICGTTYSEVEAQCPICGSARAADAQVVEEAAAVSSYTYVKGGRFSKANVRKRNSGKVPVVSEPKKPQNVQKDQTVKKEKPVKKAKKAAPNNQQKAGNESNRGLVITALVLLLAVIAVVGYIAVRYFFMPAPKGSPDIKDTIACVSLSVEQTTVSLEDGADSVELKVTPTPSNTTDTVKFESMDTNIATVDENGKVTAINPGTVQIKITCGDQECTVTVNSTVNQIVLTISPETLDLTFEGEMALVRIEGAEDLKLSDITWSSEDETIATVNDGVITAVGEGSTKIHGEYQGSKDTCMVIVKFEEELEEDDGNGVEEDNGGNGVGEDTGDGNGNGVGEDTGDGNGNGVGEDTGDATPTGELSIYIFGELKTDFTIKSGESFTLVVKDSNGNTVDATITVKDESVVAVEGNVITFVSGPSADTIITATYNGMSVDCIVRRR